MNGLTDWLTTFFIVSYSTRSSSRSHVLGQKEGSSLDEDWLIIFHNISDVLWLWSSKWGRLISGSSPPVTSISATKTARHANSEKSLNLMRYWASGWWLASRRVNCFPLQVSSYSGWEKSKPAAHVRPLQYNSGFLDLILTVQVLREMGDICYPDRVEVFDV